MKEYLIKKVTRIVFGFYLFISISTSYSEDLLKKCEPDKHNKDAQPNMSKILSLSDQVEKIESKKNCGSSKWSALKLNQETCAEILSEIEKANVSSALIPELLSAVDVVMAECAQGEDPKVVVKDVIPFTVSGTNLYFEWNEDGKLIVKIKKNISRDDYILTYSKKDLAQGEFFLSPQQKSGYSEYLGPEIKDYKSDRKSIVKRWWDTTKNLVSRIIDKGETEIYIPMIAWHGRGTYTPERIKELNEFAIGVGVGKSLEGKNGNTQVVFAMIHLDSHSEVEINVGYGWEKKINFSKNIRVGAGFAAGLASREDTLDRFPFPFILPIGSLEIGKKFSLNVVIIPKVGGVNHGNVVMGYAKYNFDK